MTSEGSVHRLFLLSLVVKGFNGCIEVIGGFILLFVTRSGILSFVAFIMRQELSEDPKDKIANTILEFVHQLPLSTKIFFGLYLLVHGGVKIFLVWNLLKEKMWVFPVALTVLLALLYYQNYRLLLHFSWPLAIFTAIDAVVILLITLEYRYRRARAFPEVAV